MKYTETLDALLAEFYSNVARRGEELKKAEAEEETRRNLLIGYAFGLIPQNTGLRPEEALALFPLTRSRFARMVGNDQVVFESDTVDGLRLEMTFNGRSRDLLTDGSEFFGVKILVDRSGVQHVPSGLIDREAVIEVIAYAIERSRASKRIA